MDTQLINQDEKRNQNLPTNAVVENIPELANRKYGLGRAIAAQVLAICAVMLSIVALYVTGISLVGFGTDFEDVGYAMLPIGLMLVTGSGVMATIALIKGIKSIKCFKGRSPRPIATFVLGISSVAEAASSFAIAIYDIIVMLISLVVLMLL